MLLQQPATAHSLEPVTGLAWALPFYLLAQGIHKPLIPEEIASHVDIPIVHQDPVFLCSRQRVSCWRGSSPSQVGGRAGTDTPRVGGLPCTHRGSKQLQVLLVHLHVQALVAAVHVEAVEKALASRLLLLRAAPPCPQLAHLHTCHSGASGEMCRAFRTSGEFRYMLGAVELVQGGSIRTFFRATGIRNRFWESWKSHCHSCVLPLLPTAAQLAGQRLLTAQQHGHLGSPAARRTSVASG